MIAILTTWWPVLVGLGVSVAAAAARWYHGRALATAEQRGRIDEIERQRQNAARQAEAERATAEALEQHGQASAARAEGSARRDAVTAAEVADWILPPEGPS